MDRQVIEYIPEWLREFKEVKILCDMQQEQAENFWEAVESIWNNNFVDTLDVHGCERWEKMLQIVNKDTYTVEERRNNIAGHLLEQRPFTYKSLCRMLDTLCGVGNYTVNIDNANYKLTMKVFLTTKNMLSDAMALLSRIVPANMVVDCTLLFNTWNILKADGIKWTDTRTWNELKEGVI